MLLIETRNENVAFQFPKAQAKARGYGKSRSL
jgi:hypothetical protein